MKRNNSFALAAALLFLTNVFSVCHAAEVIKLKYADMMAPTHRVSILAGEFCDAIKKRTNGRVEIFHYAGGTLITPGKVFMGVVTGISDLGMSQIGYSRGRFPMTEVQDLPLGTPSAYVSSQVANDFYNKFRPKEWDSVHVLHFHTTGPNVIQLINKPVRKLEDLRGLKLRATARQGDTVKALGAVPVPLEMADIYESMRRNVVDGNFGGLQQTKGWRTAELIKYITASWRLGSVYTFYVVMNKDKWNRLPNDIKQIFTDVAAEYREKYAVAQSEIDIEGRGFSLSKGVEFISLSEAESRRWAKAVEPVIEDYRKDLTSKGFRLAEINGFIAYVKERTEFWRQKEKELGIPTAYK